MIKDRLYLITTNGMLLSLSMLSRSPLGLSSVQVFWLLGGQRFFNRLFPSSLFPQCANEPSDKIILMKMCGMQVDFMKMKLTVTRNTFARRLVWKQRHKATQKWPIRCVPKMCNFTIETTSCSQT